MNMNLENNSDLMSIYGESLDQQMLNCLRVHLQTFISNNKGISLQRKSWKRKYFPAKYNGRKRPVLFAGGIEMDRGKPFPIIRIDEIALKSVNDKNVLRLVNRFRFRYSKTNQKSNTVCVKLTKNTVKVLPTLFQAQLQCFPFSRKK
jgi:hypothetical protein